MSDPYIVTVNNNNGVYEVNHENVNNITDNIINPQEDINTNQQDQDEEDNNYIIYNKFINLTYNI